MKNRICNYKNECLVDADYIEIIATETKLEIIEKIRGKIMDYYNSCVPEDKQPLQWKSRILDIINEV